MFMDRDENAAANILRPPPLSRSASQVSTDSHEMGGKSMLETHKREQIKLCVAVERKLSDPFPITFLGSLLPMTDKQPWFNVVDK